MKQKDKTVIRAGQDGVVAYANDAWYDSSRQIREGATVYSHQRIFTPARHDQDAGEAQHPRVVDQEDQGRPEGRDPHRIVSRASSSSGRSPSVSQLADSTRPWLTGGVKQYPTVVKLDDLKGQEIKPGMTAEAKVLVGELDNVLRRARAGRRRAQGRILRVRRQRTARSSFAR